MKMKGLTGKVVIWMGLPIIAVFIIAAIATRIGMSSSVTDTMNEKLIMEADAVTTQTVEFFDEHLAFCQMLAENDQIKEMVYEAQATGAWAEYTSMYPQVIKSMAGQTALYPAIMQSYVGFFSPNDFFTHDGATLHRDVPGLIVTERAWGAAAQRGEAIYMPPYVDAVTGAMVTTIAVPVYGNDNTPIAAIGIDLLLTDVQDIFDNTRVGATGFVMTFLPDGTVFYHPNADMIDQNVADIGLNAEITSAITNAETGSVMEFEYDGQKYVGTVTSVGETGWTMLTCMAQKEAYALLTNTTIAIVIVLVAALLAIIALIYVIIRRILKPIVALVYSAKKLASGDIDIDCDFRDNPTDEIDELINAFAAVVDNNRTQAEDLNRLADGDTSFAVNVRSSNDTLNIALKKVLDTINDLIAETADLTQNAILGNTAHRGNSAKFHGGYSQIIEGFNCTIEAIMTQIQIFADVTEKLGNGEIPVVDASNSQGDYVKIIESLDASVASIKTLLNDTQGMVKAATEGNYKERVDTYKYKGEFQKIVDGINKTLDRVVEQTAWYETIINSIPLPVQVMDSSQNWSLVNTSFFNTMKQVKPELSGPAALYGKKCYLEGTDINGVDALMSKGEADIRFNFRGKAYMQTTAVLKDIYGKSIGYVGTWQDLTTILKSNEFSENEIERLQGNLHNMALGNFDFAQSTQEVDEYTEAAANQFKKIDESLNEVAAAVGMLINDTKTMAEAAVAGDLEMRLDASAHNGEYAEVVEGINLTVDAILAPIQETLEVLKVVSSGNLNRTVNGDYRGGHAQTKDALNDTILHLRAVIEDISRVLSAIAEGDLTAEVVEENYQGDFNAIKDALNNITYKLRGVMKGLNESSMQVASGSHQLSEAAQTLANGSTQQASAIEELTATVTEISNQTKNNADDAREASSLANGVQSSAERGDRQMKEMLVSMDEINESSANISKIIKTIDDIAFQTNILALNAAVEAARAGVHGKGFAVVADEVRNLAAKSAQAANETTALIEGSIAKVEAGTKIANETAEALGEIVEGIGKTADIVDRIAQASGEQAVGISEVNKGIEQVSQVVQSNSATAQQSAAQSEELYGQADMLKRMVASFKIDKNGRKRSRKSKKADVKPETVTSKEPELMISLDLDLNDKY